MENIKEVPVQFACPVCGKRGRNAEWVSSKRIPQGYLYCNPKSRTGGKGCGEIFKHITRLGCMSIRIPEVMRIEANEKHKQKVLVRMSEIGFRLMDVMKSNGVHEKYRFQRKVLNRDVYSCMWSMNDLCRCGCGLTANARGMFSSNGCANLFYQVAEMIANQGEGLRRFLVELRGCKCEKCTDECKSDNYLEVDHILEVSDGGGLCWIDNFQLLCAKCHKRKTAEYAAKRALKARLMKGIESQKQTGQTSLF